MKSLLLTSVVEAILTEPALISPFASVADPFSEPICYRLQPTFSWLLALTVVSASYFALVVDFDFQLLHHYTILMMSYL